MEKGCPISPVRGGVVSIRTKKRAKARKCIEKREEERRRGVKNKRASERGLVHLNESHRQQHYAVRASYPSGGVSQIIVCRGILLCRSLFQLPDWLCAPSHLWPFALLLPLTSFVFLFFITRACEEARLIIARTRCTRVLVRFERCDKKKKKIVEAQMRARYSSLSPCVGDPSDTI